LFTRNFEEGEKQNMWKNVIGLIICVLLLIWGFTGLNENLAALHNVFLMFAGGGGIAYFGWNLLSELLFS
jgi:hypothetical protein